MKHEARYTAHFEVDAPVGVTVTAGASYTGQPQKVYVAATSAVSPEDASAMVARFVERFNEAAMSR